MLKTRLQHEFKEVSDVFKGELDEVNGKLATSDRMLSHMQRYMGKIDAELQVSRTEIDYPLPWWLSMVQPHVLV